MAFDGIVTKSITQELKNLINQRKLLRVLQKKRVVML